LRLDARDVARLAGRVLRHGPVFKGTGEHQPERDLRVLDRARGDALALHVFTPCANLWRANIAHLDPGDGHRLDVALEAPLILTPRAACQSPARAPAIGREPVAPVRGDGLGRERPGRTLP